MKLKLTLALSLLVVCMTTMGAKKKKQVDLFPDGTPIPAWFSDTTKVDVEKLLAIAVHIWQGIHVILLEHLVHLAGVGPQLIVEVAVTGGGTYDDATVAHHPLVADNLGGQGLHQHDGISSHTLAVVEELGHSEHHHVVLLLVNQLNCLLGDLIGAHVGLHIEGSNLGGRNQHAILALIGLFDAAVEEEGNVGVLLGLSDAQLGLALLGQILAHGDFKALRRIDDFQTGEGLIVLGHGDEIDLEVALAAYKAVKFRFRL